MKKTQTNNPYIIKEVVTEIKSYNPEFGDDRICECGHPYYRHFDSYEDMEPVGCKYCGCYEFKEKVESTDVDKDNKVNELLYELNAISYGWTLVETLSSDMIRFINSDNTITFDYHNNSNSYAFVHNELNLDGYYPFGYSKVSMNVAYDEMKTTIKIHFDKIKKYLDKL